MAIYHHSGYKVMSGIFINSCNTGNLPEPFMVEVEFPPGPQHTTSILHLKSTNLCQYISEDLIVRVKFFVVLTSQTSKEIEPTLRRNYLSGGNCEYGN